MRELPPILALLIALGLGSVCTAQTSPAPSPPASVDDLLALAIEDLLDIEIPVVTGASRYAQKSLLAPASVSVITADEILLHGHRSLADLLDGVRGFYVSDDRNYARVGVRGFSRGGDYNSRVLLLIDGVRVNEPIYHSMLPDATLPIDLELLERVEVIRGPASSLYGTSAFFAVVNLITRQAAALGGAEIAGEAASLDTRRGRVSWGGSTAGVDVVASGTYLDRDGDERLYFPELDLGPARRVDGEQAWNGYLRLARGGLSLQVSSNSRDKVIPTGSYGTLFNDPRNQTTDRLSFASARWTTALGAATRLEASLYGGRYDYTGDYVYAGEEDPSDLLLNFDAAHARWLGGELQATASLGQRHKLLAGVTYERQLRLDQSNHDFAVNLDDRRDGWLWAVFAQDEVTLGTHLLLSIGVRHDHYDTFGGTTNPRGALIWTPTQRSSFKLLHGRAFRAPSPYELYYHDGLYTQKPPAGGLDPERIATTELVWEQLLGTSYMLTIAGFSYRIDDLIDFTSDPADDLMTFENGSETRAEGAEVELAGQWRSGTRVRISYTYQDAADEALGTRLSNSPRHLGKLAVAVPLGGDAWTLGAEARYTGARTSVLGNEGRDALITNVSLLARGLLPGLTVAAGVYDLFDEQRADPGSEEHIQEFIRRDGRRFSLRVLYRF